MSKLMNKKHDKELFKKRLTVWILALICMILMSLVLTHDNLGSVESKKCKEVMRRFNRYKFIDGAEIYYYDKDGNTLHMETYRDISENNHDVRREGSWPSDATFCVVANIHERGKSDELKIEVIRRDGSSENKSVDRVHRGK